MFESARILLTYLASRQIRRMLVVLRSLRLMTRFHTLIHLPDLDSLTENGTSPALLFLHFFSALAIPSVSNL